MNRKDEQNNENEQDVQIEQKDSNIINEILQEPTEPVEPQIEPESTEQEKVEQEKAVDIDVTTKGIVATIDILQRTICNVVSGRSDIDFSLSEGQKQQLYNVWYPVVDKYDSHIPVEVACIVGTAVIVGGQIIYAKSLRSENKNDKKK
ncbi:MAG: hypothetical protein ACUVQP_06855 [Bacteroidales bacterium]